MAVLDWPAENQPRRKSKKMLLKSQVQRYSVESGLRDIMIAEKEIILTYAPTFD